MFKAESQTNISALSRFIIAFGGSVTALIGLVVMLGWCFHNLALIQVVPTFAPMQFNTALCFSMYGVGLLFIVFGLRRVAQIAGALVFLISLLTLAEYGTGLNLG